MENEILKAAEAENLKKLAFYKNLTPAELKNISEDKLQADCYEFFNNTYHHLRGLLYHVPNGEKRDPVTANRLKAMGVVAGVPDLELHYRKRTYFFELKKPDGSGTVSAVQKKIHSQLDLQGFIVYVVDDLETFMYLIKTILGDTSEQFTLGITKADYYYKHKIFDYLYSLSDGELVLIESITVEHTRAKFMNFVSEFMTEGYDKIEGFTILFTPDYKAIYKKLDNSDKTINYKI